MAAHTGRSIVIAHNESSGSECDRCVGRQCVTQWGGSAGRAYAMFTNMRKQQRQIQENHISVRARSPWSYSSAPPWYAGIWSRYPAAIEHGKLQRRLPRATVELAYTKERECEE